MDLTMKEKEALLAIAKNGMSNMGGKQPDHLHYDNFSWFDVSDMMAFTEFSKHQCAGLISALLDKGLIGDNGESGQKYSLYLSTKGIDEAQIIFDEVNPKTEKESTMNTINGIVIVAEADLDQFSNKELVAKYNEIQVEHGLPTIVKFADHKSAMRRTFAAMEISAANRDVETPKEVVQSAPVVEKLKTMEQLKAEFAAGKVKVIVDDKVILDGAGKPEEANYEALASTAIRNSDAPKILPEIKPEPVAPAAATPRVKGTKALTTAIFDEFYATLPKKEVVEKCVAAGLKKSSSEAFYSDYKKAHPVVAA